MTDIKRCDKEIADAEAMLRAGHLDMAGLLLKLMDWSIERRMLSESGAAKPRAGEIDKRVEAMWA
jgi:hypothetical protein